MRGTRDLPLERIVDLKLEQAQIQPAVKCRSKLLGIVIALVPASGSDGRTATNLRTCFLPQSLLFVSDTSTFCYLRITQRDGVHSFLGPSITPTISHPTPLSTSSSAASTVLHFFFHVRGHHARRPSPLSPPALDTKVHLPSPRGTRVAHNRFSDSTRTHRNNSRAGSFRRISLLRRYQPSTEMDGCA